VPLVAGWGAGCAHVAQVLGWLLEQQTDQEVLQQLKCNTYDSNVAWGAPDSSLSRSLVRLIRTR
jgi:hypothetical protein